MSDERKLLRKHREELLHAGVTDPWIERAKIFSVESVNELKGFLRRDHLPSGLKPPAWCVPYFRLGEPQDYHLLKPDHPRCGDGGKIIKYEVAVGCPNRVFFPPEMGLADFLDSSKTLILTEGIKKSLAAASRGLLALSVNGVWGWIVRRERDDDGRPIGEPELIPDLEQLVWHGREVILCFDSDAATNPKVMRAETELRRALEKRGAQVVIVRLPARDDGEKVGLDDYLLRPGKDAFLDLLKEARERAATVESLTPVSIGELAKKHKRMRPPIIQGLLRLGEVCNVIAPPKTGKSWLTYGLGLSIVTGAPWLFKFPCEPGRLLLIDNELHDETLARRIPDVADAMRIELARYRDRLDVVSLRGRLTDYHGMGRLVDKLAAGHYSTVIVDAHYRALPAGVSENANAEMAQVFNLIDRYAAQTQSAWILVHHSTKGSQGEKEVVDVGAGAGSQARAADTHLILRAHEEPGHYVLDAAVRSWPPIEPMTIAWKFPLWIPSMEDPSLLKGRLPKSEQRQIERDDEGRAKILELLGKQERMTASDIRAIGRISNDRVKRLLAELEGEHRIESRTVTRRGNQCKEYSLNGSRNDDEHGENGRCRQQSTT